MKKFWQVWGTPLLFWFIMSLVMLIWAVEEPDNFWNWFLFVVSPIGYGALVREYGKRNYAEGQESQREKSQRES